MKSKNIDLQKKYKNWLLDHIVIKYIVEYFEAFIVSTISALFFAFTMKLFVMPTAVLNSGELKLATGGASGISQDITLLLELIFGTGNINEDLCYSLFYLIVNIPLICLSFFYIGKRFTLLTLVNVIESSLLINLFSGENIEWINTIAEFVNDNGGMLARAIFGGVCIGLSSALPYKLDFSAGGVDILTYLISAKRDTTTGKFTVAINSLTIFFFCILTAAINGWGSNTAISFVPILYCILYLFVGSLIIDAIHIRNKKCEIKIVTENTSLSDVLLTKIPHGATIIKGIGAYSGSDKFIISMVISSNEVNSIVKIIKETDPKSFVEVFELHKVLGSFYLKPIK